LPRKGGEETRLNSDQGKVIDAKPRNFFVHAIMLGRPIKCAQDVLD